ncbi:hypothetical protein DSCOOX_58940 [Desulfosarcina ovata subsp. ovata]|uniref:Uncharacterized protein n=2 Tax=Desulfosarcina ovata TaxID=83564 RepID=A0A5K8AM69_9BACT|nr:hypothetical protein DSCOOX_58940 [Desulfosarcina ovata subsp. ovata]
MGNIGGCRSTHHDEIGNAFKHELIDGERMNPYTVLNVDPHATKKEIIQAVARGMREKKYTGRELAQAQKMLLDPVSAAVQEFIHCIHWDDVRRSLPSLDGVMSDRGSIAGLKRLSIGDEEA